MRCGINTVQYLQRLVPKSCSITQGMLCTLVLYLANAFNGKCNHPYLNLQIFPYYIVVIHTWLFSLCDGFFFWNCKIFTRWIIVLHLARHMNLLETSWKIVVRENNTKLYKILQQHSATSKNSYPKPSSKTVFFSF